jgi:hypothetical protein
VTSFGLPSNELIHVEDRRQEEVPDDHERDQTEGNDHTSESVTGPDRRPDDHHRDQADGKPERRILHVAKHEVTLAPGTRSDTAAARIATSISWELIDSCSGTSTERTFAELLIDCEEDRTLRAVLVGMLREGRQGSSR